MSDKLKALNLYRPVGDRDIWDRIEQLAKMPGWSTSKVVSDLLRKGLRMNDLADDGIVEAPTVEVVGARLAVETIEYPNAIIGVDSGGEVVSVEFTQTAYVE